MTEEVQARLDSLARLYVQSTPTGEKTFAGVLCQYFAPPAPTVDPNWISRGWNENTQNTYLKHYEERIIPYLPKRKAIGELRIEDYESVIEAVREDKGIENEQVLQHLRFIMHRVSFVAFRQGACEHDILWGTYFGTEAETDKPEKLLTRTKHSLTPAESIAVYEALMQDPKEMSGEQLGLLIMFLTGLRNNEACALRFDDWKPMKQAPSVTCVWVYKSTVSGSNQLKASGKTHNADRVLPVLDFLAEMIAARRGFLEELVAQGTLVLDQMQVGELPIACVGKQYTKGATTDDLSLAGRLLLRNLKFDEYALTELDSLLHTNAALLEGLVEKDATTYLYRRNMVTTLYLLGLSEPEIQYYIGHDVEDTYLTRNMFTNADCLLELKRKLNAHPLNRLRYAYQPREIVLKANQTAEFRAEMGQKVMVKSGRKKLQVHLSCELQELKDTFGYRLDGAEQVTGEVHFWHGVSHGERVADVRDAVYEQFIRAEQARQQKKPVAEEAESKAPSEAPAAEDVESKAPSEAPAAEDVESKAPTQVPLLPCRTPVEKPMAAGEQTDKLPMDFPNPQAVEHVEETLDAEETAGKPLITDTSGRTERGTDPVGAPDLDHMALLIGDGPETSKQAEALRACGFAIEQVKDVEEAISRYRDSFPCRLLFVDLCGQLFDQFPLDKMPIYQKDLPVYWYSFIDRDDQPHFRMARTAKFEQGIYWPLAADGLQRFCRYWTDVLAKRKTKSEESA